MKRIYIDIEEKYRNVAFEKMTESLWGAGIEVYQLCRDGEKLTVCPEGERFPEDADTDGALLLTENQKTADRAAERNIACAGYEPLEKGITLSRVDIVIQGFEELDAEFFKLIYRRHHGLPWMIGETDRLLIRESIPEDFDALYEIYQEPGMTDYMPGMTGEKEAERELFLSYIRRMYPFFSYGLWTVLEKRSGRIVGRAGLENGRYREKPVLEIGYMISRAYRKRGYGLEAVRKVLDYGFSCVGAEEIYAFICEENQASLNLAQKAGMRRTESDRLPFDRYAALCCKVCKNV